MIKRLFISLGLVLFLSSCYGPERNCEDYKTGTFKFAYELDGIKKEGKFIRNDSYSVDFYENKIDSATIRWYNECEYVLQDINSKVAIQYKIISTTDSTYTFQYKSAVQDPNKELVVKTGTAVRIE